MSHDKKKPLSPAAGDHLFNTLLAEEKQRQSGYREQALKLFPWVCARCSREFEGKKVRELTVHHKDHNHDNNPPDGSNWELLCLYCHDHEHTRGIQADREELETNNSRVETLVHSPFAALAEKLSKQNQ
ncbi:YajD family HNH nuclease [Pelobacter seleniigenes]|uniref:YajD family HNH nuclease n=1 Tax=Pelobacter seleniigenes TaxID=407188 RepID=UPI0006893682|nr:YajD family HNH nuclease [Pelobacter seleniigenes]